MHRFIQITSLLILIVLCFGCKRSDPETAPLTDDTVKSISYSARYSTDVPEPSGLMLDVSREYLWTVSDQTGKVYKINLEGKIVKTLSFVGNDLEAVTQNPVDQTLWVAQEGLRDLVHLDTNGNIIERYSYSGITSDPNSGFEGLAYNRNNGHFYVINEKKPVLLIEIDETMKIVNQKQLDYATDISDIYYDEKTNNFWLLSDESSLVIKCDADMKAVEKYNIGLTKMEGISIQIDKKMIYLISDYDGKLYHYIIP